MRRTIFFLLLVGGVALLSACDVPTDLSVNSTADAPDAVPGDGVCETAVEDECTLRAAVMEANALDSPVTIHLAEGATYDVPGAGLDDDAAAVGDLDITGNVSIAGNGATLTTSDDRILDNHGTLRLDDVTLEGELAFGLPGQQALRNQGEATVVDSTVHTWLSQGGAIQHVSGGLLLARTNVFDAQRGLGVEAGTVLVVDSSIHTTGCGYPCAAWDAVVQTGGDLTIVNSTIAQHRRTGFWPCHPTLPACSVPVKGDGLVQTGGSATLVRSTVANNLTGIVGANVTLHGTVVADNEVADCSAPVTSLGHNHDEDGSCLATPAEGDQTGPAGLATTIVDDAVLPLAGSPLLDRIPAGTPQLCDGVHPGDQRGAPRPAGTACDVGAIERQPTDP